MIDRSQMGFVFVDMNLGFPCVGRSLSPMALSIVVMPFDKQFCGARAEAVVPLPHVLLTEQTAGGPSRQLAPPRAHDGECWRIREGVRSGLCPVCLSFGVHHDELMRRLSLLLVVRILVLASFFHRVFSWRDSLDLLEQFVSLVLWYS